MEDNININIIKKIKSNYMLKGIFSLLIDYIKLDMLNYNKLLQKRIQISTEDYKKICKKYKIIEKPGKIKEFDLITNKLIYEGEYLKGKRNGKGKEYDINNNIVFEGEYLKGKKIEGKGYDKDGNIIFILNRNRKGKEFYDNGEIQFEGEYLNGKRWNGKGFNYNGKNFF